MMDIQIALIDGGNKATDDCGQILKCTYEGGAHRRLEIVDRY